MRAGLLIGIYVALIEALIAVSPLTWRFVPISLLVGAATLALQQRRFARRLKTREESRNEKAAGE